MNCNRVNELVVAPSTKSQKCIVRAKQKDSNSRLLEYKAGPNHITKCSGVKHGVTQRHISVASAANAVF